MVYCIWKKIQNNDQNCTSKDCCSNTAVKNGIQFVTVKKRLFKSLSLYSVAVFRLEFSDHLVALKGNRTKGREKWTLLGSQGHRWIWYSPHLTDRNSYYWACFFFFLPSRSAVVCKHVWLPCPVIIPTTVTAAPPVLETEVSFLNTSSFSLSLPIVFVHFPSVLSLVSEHFSLLFISKHNSCSGPFGSSSQTFTLILSIWRGIKVCCKWLNCKFRHVDVSPTRILVSCTNKGAKLFQVWTSASLMILLN